MPWLLYSAMCCLILMILCCFGLMSWCVYVIALRCFYCKFRQDQGKIPDHILQMHRSAPTPTSKREILKQLFVKEGDSRFWTMDVSKPMFQESSTRSTSAHDKHTHKARSRMMWEATIPGGPRILILTRYSAFVLIYASRWVLSFLCLWFLWWCDLMYLRT